MRPPVFSSFLLLASLFWASPASVAQEFKGEESEVLMVWVFFQFNVPEDEGVEDYYYAGQVESELFEQIVTGEVTHGLIPLKNVCYLSNSQWHAYEDDLDSGLLVFRIEHIQRMIHMKRNPLEPEEDYSHSEGSEEDPDMTPSGLIGI